MEAVARQTRTRRVKIVGDGTPLGTRVFDEETGDLIENITRVEFYHEAGGVPVARIFCTQVATEIVAYGTKRPGT